MKRGADWYQREPRAMIDGKRSANLGQGMTVRQAAIYDLVIDLIYEGSGETPNNPQHFASHFLDMGTRAARQAVNELVDMEKLSLRDGMLHNKRAENQAITRRELSEKRAESGRKGGENSGKIRRELSKNNYLTKANGSSKKQPDKIRVESESESIGILSVFDRNRWFTDKQLTALKVEYPDVPLIDKLNDPLFQNWCFQESPDQPQLIATNWIKKQAQTVASLNDLAQRKVDPADAQPSSSLLNSPMVKNAS